MNMDVKYLFEILGFFCLFVCLILSGLHAETHDPEIKTWAEIKSQILNCLSHLGAPKTLFLIPLFIYIYT